MVSYAGSFYVTISESTIITCEGGRPGHKFRTIIEYKEESWLGRAHFLLEGVIHTVFDSDANRCAEWTKVKHVPKDRVVAVFDGSWRGQYPLEARRPGLIPRGGRPQRRHALDGIIAEPVARPAPHSEHPLGGGVQADIGTSEEDWTTLVDLASLSVMPKTVRPLERQHPRESRKLWETVTENLVKKEFSEAYEGESQHRAAAARRGGRAEAQGYRVSTFRCVFSWPLTATRFVPRYFENDLDDGFVELTAEGRAAVEEELKEDSSYCIEGIDVAANLAT